MGEVLSMIVLTMMGVGSVVLILFLNKRKKKMDDIYAAITVSNITSIPVISQTLALEITETRKLTEKIISHAKHNFGTYPLLKNAYIDRRTDKIILHPKANDNLINKTLHYLADGLSLKKKIKEDWTCHYCNTLNKPKTYICSGCGANKSQHTQ